MSVIMAIFHKLNDTVQGQCMGTSCGKMLTSADKDHALCNACWTVTFQKSGKPKKCVTFKGFNVETMMKPPCDTKLFNPEAPPSCISSSDEDQDAVPLRKSKKAWVPPHLR